jgi:hypothetical protein
MISFDVSKSNFLCCVSIDSSHDFRHNHVGARGQHAKNVTKHCPYKSPGNGTWNWAFCIPGRYLRFSLYLFLLPPNPCLCCVEALKDAQYISPEKLSVHDNKSLQYILLLLLLLLLLSIRLSETVYKYSCFITPDVLLNCT